MKIVTVSITVIFTNSHLKKFRFKINLWLMMKIAQFLKLYLM